MIKYIFIEITPESFYLTNEDESMYGAVHIDGPIGRNQRFLIRQDRFLPKISREIVETADSFEEARSLAYEAAKKDARKIKNEFGSPETEVIEEMSRGASRPKFSGLEKASAQSQPSCREDSSVCLRRRVFPE